MKTTRFITVWCGLAVGVFSLLALVRATVAQDVDLAAEEAKQRAIMERFVTVLEKNPRRGVALDKVYGHHIEWGTVDKYLTELRERTVKTPQDGTGWMILGLFEAQRGEDAAAVAAYTQAEKHLPENALASYYLAQALVLVGQTDEAVAAFERSITRKPLPQDALEIFQQLGRLHQRAQRTDKALEVWGRLEKLFPSDPRVQEQIAVTLVEEGQAALALPRYELLAKLSKDDYRKTVYRMEAAELKVKLGKKDDGLRDLEKVMADLNPTSWLHRDVRRRIDDVYLRGGDQDGLVKYYEAWIAKNPEDVDAMARLGKTLADAARVPEASVWLNKALKLAPKRKELRLAFIDQLLDDQKYAEAAKQYEELVKHEPGNPDYVQDWGKTLLKDKAVPEEARQKAAEQVWRKLLVAKPKDALVHSQVADMFRQSNMPEPALELYKKAIELSPEDPQYREYLGEYYHVLKRGDEALSTWKEIASGKRRTATNVTRLAQVFNGFGYAAEAVIEIAAACKLDPKDFALQLQAAEYHSKAEKHDDALAFVSTAEKLAATDDEREEILAARIGIFQSQNTLDERIAEQQEAINKLVDASLPKPAATAETMRGWYVLARYYEASRQFPEASKAITKAVALEPTSILALSAAARIAEQGGNLAEAADLNRKLALVDRRSKTDYLEAVAKLETQLGRTDAALAAGREVIAAAPGKTEGYEFFAQLCFRLGKNDEGLETLRRAVRINPTEPALASTLAAALAEQFRTDEAIETYWRAFEKVEELEDQIGLIMKLTDLHMQTNQFEKLIDRLERDRREEEKRRGMTICIAQAYHSSGDFGTARQELESLLSTDTKDTQLLNQLSKLAEGEQDFAGAIKYQEQLVKVAPGPETEQRLATLFQSSGQTQEATEILVRLVQKEEDAVRLHKSLDGLLNNSAFDMARQVMEPLMRQGTKDWEMMYREAVTWAMEGKKDEARPRMQRILDLNLPVTTLGEKAKRDLAQAQTKAKSEQLKGAKAATVIVPQFDDFTALNDAYSVRRAVGIEIDYYGQQQQQAVWMPIMYGQARMAAMAWMLKFCANDEAAVESLVTEYRTKATVANAPKAAILDWIYLQTLRNEGKDVFEATRELAKSGDRVSQTRFLAAISQRTQSAAEQQQVYYSENNGVAEDKTPPMADADIALMLECYNNLPATVTEHMGGQFGNTGRLGMIGIVMLELKRAKREAEGEKLLEVVLAAATTPAEFVLGIGMHLEKEDVPQALAAFAAWSKAELAREVKQRTQAANYYEGPVTSIVALMGRRGQAKEHADVLALLDNVLDHYATDGAQRRQLATATRKRRSTMPQNQGNFGLQLYWGKENVYAQLDFPQPNQYVNYSELYVLRQAYEVYQRNDLMSDLVQHLKSRADKAEGPAKVSAALLHGYLQWWTEEREEAVASLTAASELVPDDLDMRLEMVALLEAQGNLDDALDMADKLVPVDQVTLQRRELTAMRLAERLGDIDRARLAAERLFGLRLDVNAQLALASQMRRLGLNEMAESITARASKQAGNKISALTLLMAQYQGQGQSALAEQIAHNILRRTQPQTARTQMQQRHQGTSESAQARQQALSFLSTVGALSKMIERLEEQVAKAPNSPVTAQLIECYQTIGEQEKAYELQAKMVLSRPDDVEGRLGLAQSLQQRGKHDEACEHYLFVLKKKPEYLMNDFYQVQNTFESANKRIELAEAIDAMDIKQFRSPWNVTNLAQNMLQDEKTQQLGLKLFKKAFAGYPQYRQYFIQNLHGDQIWKLPEVLEMAKQGIVPPAGVTLRNPWLGLESNSRGSGGEAYGMFKQIFDGAAQANKLSEVRQTLVDGVKAHPEWKGGVAMLACLDIREGKSDEGRKALMALVGTEEDLKKIPYMAKWIIGQELDQLPEGYDLAVKLFSSAILSPEQANYGSQYQYSPTIRLVKLLQKMDKKDEARDILVKSTKVTNPNSYGNEEYYAYQRISSHMGIANALIEMESPVEALTLYRKLLDDPQALKSAEQYGGSGSYETQAQEGLKKSLAALKPETAGQAVLNLIRQQDVSETPGPEGTAPAAKPKKKDEPAVDLMLTLPGASDLKKSQMSSSLLTMLEELSKHEQLKTAIATEVPKLAQAEPNDFAALTMQAVYLLKMQPDQAGPAIEQIVKALEAAPLEVVADGKRPNSRQREAAARQIPVWLVARECLRGKTHPEAGKQLGERALVAAARQIENTHSVSILYEWGEIALANGDKPTAEEFWTKLLELATARPKSRAKPAAAPVPAPAPAAAMILYPNGVTPFSPGLPAAGYPGLGIERATANPKGVASSTLTLPDATPLELKYPSVGTQPRVARCASNPGLNGGTPLGFVSGVANLLSRTERIPQSYTRGLTPDARRRLSFVNADAPGEAPKPPAEFIAPLSVEQFQLAVQVSKVAAEQGFIDLSLRAIRQGLIGGTPVPASEQPGAAVPVRSFSGGGMNLAPQADDASLLLVATSLADLSKVWANANVPPQTVYELIAPAVFPVARPNEILLCIQDSEAGLCLGNTLIDWAKRADKMAELKALVATRSNSPQAGLSGAVMVGGIAHTEKDVEGVKAALKQIDEALNKDSTVTSVQAALLLVNKVFPDPEYQATAAPIFQRCLTSFRTQGSSVTESLTRRLHDYLAKQGDKPGIKKLLDEHLAAEMTQYARYGGTYGNYMMQQGLIKAAESSARWGFPDLSLEYLARSFAVPKHDYGTPSSTDVLPLVGKFLLSLPAEERYKTLHDWIMPEEKRREFRYLAIWNTRVQAPEVFLAESAKKHGDARFASASGLSQGDYSSMWRWLLDAAAEAGQIDALAQEAQAAVDSKVPDAEHMLALVHLQRSDIAAAEPLLRSLTASMQKRANDETQRNQRRNADYLTLEYELSKAALMHTDPVARALGQDCYRELGHAGRSRQAWAIITHARYDLAARDIADTQGATLTIGQPIQAPHWHVSDHFGYGQSEIPEWWLAHDGQFTHVGGADQAFLNFNYPIVGDFEFTCDAFSGGWGEGDIGYGGFIVESQQRGSNTQIFQIGANDSISRPDPMERDSEHFNRLSIRIQDGMFRYGMNGYQVYEEPAHVSSPWLQFFTHYARHTGWKNLKITGSPTIPAEVPLLVGNRLDGWTTSFYNDTQPRRRVAQEPAPTDTNDWEYRQRKEPPHHDWTCEAGLLSSRKEGGMDAIHYSEGTQFRDKSPGPSRITYHRPLRPGDSLRYDFFYEPGQSHIYPTMGRIALLLRPEGIAEHYMTNGSFETDVLRLDAQNELTVPTSRRGSGMLPLKPGEWNRGEVALVGDSMQLSLNGELVYERPLESDNDRKFGFFRRRGDFAVKVKDVVLKGDWPAGASVDEINKLLTEMTPLAPVDRLLATKIVGDKYLVDAVPDLLTSAKSLDAEARYESLKKFVLPGERPNFSGLYAVRPVASQAALNPVGRLSLREGTSFRGAKGDSLALVNAAAEQVEQSDFAAHVPWDSPAIELLRVTDELGKFNDLEAAIDAAPGADSTTMRDKLSLQLMIEVVRGENLIAQECLSRLYLLDEEANVKFGFNHQLEATALYVALSNPELSRLVHSVAQHHVERHLAGEGQHPTRRVFEDIRLLANLNLDGGGERGSNFADLTQWAYAPYSSAKARGVGDRCSTWRFRKGHVEHEPGDQWSQLWFQSPLSGDITIECDRSTSGWREILVCFGTRYSEPTWDLTGRSQGVLMHNQSLVDGRLPIPDWNRSTVRYKIDVKGRDMKLSANGVEFDQLVLPEKHDSWVTIQSHTTWFNSHVSDLRITGTPVIPDQLVISDNENLNGWRADSYDWMNMANEAAPWTKQGDDIIGRAMPKGGPTHVESLLVYQRPFTFNGTIDYEFFYEAGKSEVHPALGNVAYVVTPLGVKLHQLTNAQWEHTGLTPDNMSDLPVGSAVRTAPEAQFALKEKDWNTMRLTVTGDDVLITVNGAAVAKHTLPAANSRQFGLFRYRDRYECKVRKVTLAGDWPKSLPELADQQLAAAPEGLYTLSDDRLPNKLVWELNQPLSKLAEQGLAARDGKEMLHETKQGVHVVMPAGQKKHSGASLVFAKPLQGDFEITLQFSGLKLVNPMVTTHAGVEIELHFPNQTTMYIRRLLALNGDNIVQSILAYDLPNHKPTYPGRDIASTADAGRLRIVREGGRLHGLFATGDSNDFKLIESHSVSGDETSEIHFLGRVWHEAAGCDVLLERATIRYQGASSTDRASRE